MLLLRTKMGIEYIKSVRVAYFDVKHVENSLIFELIPLEFEERFANALIISTFAGEYLYSGGNVLDKDFIEDILEEILIHRSLNMSRVNIYKSAREFLESECDALINLDNLLGQTQF